MEQIIAFLKKCAPDLYGKLGENPEQEVVYQMLNEAQKRFATPLTNLNNANGAGQFNLPTDHLLSDPKKVEQLFGMLDGLSKSVQLNEAARNLDNTLNGHVGLPQVIKDRVRSNFDGKVFLQKDLDDYIKKEQEYAASIAGDIDNSGGLSYPSRIAVGENPYQKMAKALDGFFADEDVDKVPRFQSMRHAYVSMTGDENLTGLTRDAKKLKKLTASLDTSSWGEVLGDSITRRMQQEYKLPANQYWKLIVSTIGSIRDFRTNRRMRICGYGDLPTVAQSGTYQPLTSPTDEEATYSISKKGGLEELTLEMIANDDIGAIKRIPLALARAASRTLMKAVFDTVRLNQTCTYDSVALFHANHNNLGSAALSDTSLTAARVAMITQTPYNQSLEQLGILPKYVLVPPQLEKLAWKLTNATFQVGSAEGTPRYTDREPNWQAQIGLTPIMIPYWTDANDWALVCDPRDCATIEVGFYNNIRDPELFIQDLPTQGSMFTADLITYKIRHIWGICILDHRGFYKAVVA